MTDDFGRDGQGGGRDEQGKDDKPERKGERRYGKPVGGGRTGERRYGKPANGGAPGERRYGKPASGGATGERRYAKPAPRFARSASSGTSGASTGANASASGERRYGKPANGSAPGAPRYAKPAPRFARPVSGGNPNAPTGANASASGERRYGKPANGGTPGAPRYAKPAPRFARPTSSNTPNASTGATASAPGERRYGKPANGSAPGAPRYAKPAPRFARPVSGNTPGAPTGATASAPTAPRYAKPAPRFARPVSGGNSSYSNAPATPRRPGGAPRPFAKPRAFSSAKPIIAKPVSAPAAEETGLRLGARRLAFDILCDVHQNGAFAALSLNEHLRGKPVSPEDRRLLTSIVYGTLENELQIDFALDRLMEHPTREPSQRDILRMSAYQILFLDRVPDSAAVNEAVKLCKIVGMEGASGFVNAVLRNLVRGKDEIPWPKREDDLREYLRLMTSTPMWLVDRLMADYGAEEAERILSYREAGHPVVVRPNLYTSSDEALEKLLTDKGWRFERGVAPHAFLVFGGVELHLDPDYQKGLFSIQGQSSMLAAEAVDAKPGMKILDACAAPGGKSAYLCERMQLTGRVYAWELHEKRTLLLEAAKRRLHLENLRITTRDATEPRPDLEGTLDAVLLDAPCSGTGVMAQKPDIKLRVTEEDVAQIADTQKRLLDALCKLVRPGGTLVYSTCSILPRENEEQIARFLAEHPDFALDSLPLSFPEALRRLQTARGLQLLGYRDGMEGFYIARLRRAR